MKKLLFLVLLINLTSHTLVHAHENTHIKKTSLKKPLLKEKKKRALQIFLASISCVLVFSYFLVEAKEEKNTVPEVDLGKKMGVGIWSIYRFCWLTGIPILFFADCAETLIKSMGTSTDKPFTIGNTLVGIATTIFSYFYIKKIAYPSAKKTYEEMCSFTQSSNAAISDG